MKERAFKINDLQGLGGRLGLASNVLDAQRRADRE